MFMFIRSLVGIFVDLGVSLYSFLERPEHGQQWSASFDAVLPCPCLAGSICHSWVLDESLLLFALLSLCPPGKPCVLKQYK